MRKPIIWFSIIYSIPSLILLYLSKVIFKNRFFIPSIIISLGVLFLIGLMFIIILMRLYQKKINQKLVDVQRKEQSQHAYPFEHWYKRFKLWYLIMFLLPLCLVLSIEYMPKHIYTLNDFEKIKINPDGHYILMNDLDLLNRKQETEYYTWCSESYFDGVFDGNNKTLNNVNQTLFFCTLNHAVIKNLTLKNVEIKARYAEYTGVIANRNYGLIDNVNVEGTVTGYERTGGIVGTNDWGTIQNSSFMGHVNGLNRVGGLIGSNYNSGKVIKSYVKGTITGQYEVGGLIGDSGSGTIDTTYVIGTVTGNRGVGGLVGFTQMLILNSYTVTEVHGTGYGVGGISGQSLSDVKNSFSLGNTTGTNVVGGISGYSRYLENCFAYGNVNSDEEQAYGLVNREDESTITNSYQYEHQLINDQSKFTESIVTKSELLDINWYRNVLKLDENIWDLYLVKDGYFPQLIGLPNQDKVTIK